MSSALVRGRGAILAVLPLLLVLFIAVPALAQSFPKLSGRVVDEAGILSPATETALTAKLKGLEDQTGRQLVVVTLRSLEGREIEEYGYRLGREWKIGQKGTNDGVLLIVAPNEKKVRIEVGYGLEGVLTDALSSVILQSAVLPKFREGDMEAGVVAGADALVQQLALPDDQARARVAQAAERQSRDDKDFPIGALFPIFIFGFFIFLSMIGGRRRRRRGLDALPWIIGSGGWSSGSGGGGGWSGGGGFSGGGGSFGGGGASGGW